MGDPYDYNLMPESWRIEQLEDRIKQLEAENERLTEIMRWTQSCVTALAVGDIKKDSLLHHKIRDLMIAYRE